MTLRTSYFDGETGLQAKLLAAFDAGAALVTTNNTAITTGLQTAAAQGKTTFTVQLTTTYQPAALRLQGLLMQAFLDGVSYQLASEDIMAFECTPSLNTSDLATLKVDLLFNFATS